MRASVAADLDDSVDTGHDTRGAEFRHFLIGLHIRKNLSAVDLSILCWHATRCGAVGVQNLSMPPGSNLGNYNRKVAQELEDEPCAGQIVFFRFVFFVYTERSSGGERNERSEHPNEPCAKPSPLPFSPSQVRKYSDIRGPCGFV